MIEGLDTLFKKLDKLPSLVEKAVEEGLNEAGVLITQDAKMYCPVDTGALRESIDFKVEDGTLSVGTDLYYAPYVEFGTYKMRPQPYLTPAIEQNKDKIVDIIAKNIEEAIK